MCGISGIIDLDAETDSNLITTITSLMSHRGPDNFGTWANNNNQVHLGHRRLSIIDLSPNGHQPMLSQDQRFVITFNGEIFNYLEIASELKTKGHIFKGGSDTEVILAAILEWGVEKAVSRFVGMFAFGLFDQQEKTFYLVRDRVGIKPLYYSLLGRKLIFASELKALEAHPNFNFEINSLAVEEYFRFGFIGRERTIYKDSNKLLPAHILSFKVLDQDSKNPIKLEISKYWELSNFETITKNSDELQDEVDQIIKESVKLRMIADVPVGAFLSGGVDSSVIVALMQQLTNKTVKTFTIAFDDIDYDESEYANAVASHLETDHHCESINSKDAIALIPQIFNAFDEPFANSSHIPTLLVSKLARSKVTVSLSGDGGDELFLGYNRYFRTKEVWKNLRYFPISLRSLLSYTLKSLEGKKLDAIYARLSGNRFNKALDKAKKLVDVLGSNDIEELYLKLLAYSDASNLSLNKSKDISKWKKEFGKIDESLSLERNFMKWDLLYYLPDELLTKLDRTTMAVSLEARVPLLDHRIIELSSKLHSSLLYQNGTTKLPLRNLLYKYVPKNLIERPKMGFSVPIGKWLREDLREMAEDLLSEDKIKNGGFLDHKKVSLLLKEHLSLKKNHQHILFSILSFQAWRETKKVFLSN